jgi:hypothetical protein
MPGLMKDHAEGQRRERWPSRHVIGVDRERPRCNSIPPESFMADIEAETAQHERGVARAASPAPRYKDEENARATPSSSGTRAASVEALQKPVHPRAR